MDAMSDINKPFEVYKRLFSKIKRPNSKSSSGYDSGFGGKPEIQAGKGDDSDKSYSEFSGVHSWTKKIRNGSFLGKEKKNHKTWHGKNERMLS